MTKVLMVIAPSGFRDEEYAVPKEVLESRGVVVDTASTRTGLCDGRFGLQATATVTVREADPADYAAVLFVGGPGADIYFDDALAHNLARAAYASGALVGAICIAPATLAHAGLLKGVRVTSFPSVREDVVLHGARWSEEPVVVDGRIITANGPESARKFGLAVADALGAQ